MSPASVKRSTLWALLGAAPPPGPDAEVRRVTRDSREVEWDTVFVAIRGAAVDGHALAPALRCAGLVVERPVDAAAPQVCVADGRAALATLSAALHGWPGAQCPVVGVTGTNGKTTVTSLVVAAASHLGQRWGRIGTLGAAFGAQSWPGRFTTPEAPELQATLRRMVHAGADGVAMEVSSIGLLHRRVDAIPFHLAVFTNLTQDHLDVHGDMESYRAAKARLFEELLRPPGGPPRALLCADDPSWTRMGAPPDRLTWGTADGADLHYRVARADAAGMRIDVQTPEGPVAVATGLVGAHNAQNAVAALGVLMILGHAATDAAEAVGRAPAAPGRLQRVDNGRGLLVLVDYAHTEDALAHALAAVRPLTSGRLWVVFGCGGDRDRGKRPRMGAIAEAGADRVVLTSDNPRGEEPTAIAAEVLAGVRRPDRVCVALDRGDAIRLAIAEARAGDAILVAGKGHEATQEIAGQFHPFDDVAVCAAALSER